MIGKLTGRSPVMKAGGFWGDVRVSDKGLVNISQVHKSLVYKIRVESMEQSSSPPTGGLAAPPNPSRGPLGLPPPEPLGLIRAKLITGWVQKNDLIGRFNKDIFMGLLTRMK